MIGPIAGPLLGGALSQGLGWRSTFVAMAVCGGAIFLSLLFFMEEVGSRAAPQPCLGSDRGGRGGLWSRLGPRQCSHLAAAGPARAPRPSLRSRPSRPGLNPAAANP